MMGLSPSSSTAGRRNKKSPLHCCRGPKTKLIKEKVTFYLGMLMHSFLLIYHNNQPMRLPICPCMTRSNPLRNLNHLIWW